jgi:hypothetical protein
MEYIHNNGYLPILYTLGGSENFVEKVCKYLSFQPPCFIGLKLDTIHKIIVDSWINKIYEPLLPSINSEFEDCIKYYNLGTSSSLDDDIFNCNANDLNIGININKYYKTPKLIILVGQPGSGKSCIASKFAKNGWFVIKEKESIKYMRSGNVSTLYTLISQIGEKSGVGKFGVIVDAANCLKKDRDFYIELAKKAKKKYIVGWVTRPGYFYNNKKAVKVSDIMLDKYSTLLEPLTKDENGVRFV